MTAILDRFRADCRGHYARRPGSARCSWARRKVRHALLARHDPVAVMRWWLAVARVLDGAEREARGGG